MSVLAKIGIASLAATAASGILVYSSLLPQEAHSAILGGLSMAFILTDLFFSRLLTELTNIQRRTGYSVWQANALAEVIQAYKGRLWSLFWWLIALKAIGLSASALVAKAKDGSSEYFVAIWCGYFAISATIPILYRLIKGYKAMDKKCDEIVLEEIRIKEKRRLLKDLESGKSYDYENDKALKSYSKEPTPI